MPWMLFLLATTLSRAAHSRQTQQHKEGSPSSARTGPRHLQSACSTPPTLLGTHWAHTKFLQIFPSANWAPKCTFTVQSWKQGCRWQREHGSYSLESYSLDWAREAPDCARLSASEALTRVAWPGAGHWSSRRDPHNGSTSRRHPASHTLFSLA